MKTVLVIEDKQIVQDAIRDWLEEAGFQTLGASSGALGIQLAQDQSPDLILCDIIMPGIDGYAVLSHLRQNPITATIPFIFLTVKGTKVDIRHGMELGADDYLTKPCTAQELINAVTSRLEKQAQIQAQCQQQLEALRNSIAFSLPHEFRTPLTGILTGIELLRVLADHPDEVLEVANTLEDSTQRLHDLIKKFLVYVELEILARNPERAQALQSSESWEPIGILRDIILRIVERYGREQDLQLSLEKTRVFLPPERLEKVIEELVDNACKFSELETPIQVISTINELLDGSRYCEIKITNQGQGLTEEQLSNIGAYMQFNRPYYEQQGTGLGLSIAQRIVELYGGSLAISSTFGITSVSVILPAAI